jgi:hypothetical protein
MNNLVKLDAIIGGLLTAPALAMAFLAAVFANATIST